MYCGSASQLIHSRNKFIIYLQAIQERNDSALRCDGSDRRLQGLLDSNIGCYLSLWSSQAHLESSEWLGTLYNREHTEMEVNIAVIKITYHIGIVSLFSTLKETGERRNKLSNNSISVVLCVV